LEKKHSQLYFYTGENAQLVRLYAVHHHQKSYSLSLYNPTTTCPSFYRHEVEARKFTYMYIGIRICSLCGIT